MGQKINPIGNRLGIIKGWDSNWFGGKTTPLKIEEDYKIRKYLRARFLRLAFLRLSLSVR
jgi:small subunit ribosomal protein S3